MAHYLLAGRPARHSVTQGFLLAQGLGREEGGLWSHLFWPNGNTPPRAPETPEGQPYGADPRSVTCPQGPSGCLGLDSPHFPVGSMLTRPGAACSWRSPPRCWGPGPAVAKGPLKAGARTAAGKEPGETAASKSAWPTPVPGGGPGVTRGGCKVALIALGKKRPSVGEGPHDQGT